MQTVELPIIFSQEQVDDFGRITGDDGPVHSVDGIVQGGFIISSLPRWLKQLPISPVKGHERSVSVMLDVKFRNKLPVDTPAIVSFSFSGTAGSVGKMTWRIFSHNLEYCSGSWLVLKVKN